MPGAPTPQELEATLDAILAPLREQVEIIDAEIAALEVRRAELREMRAKPARIIAATERSGHYASKQQKQPVKSAAGKPSETKLNELEDYLRASVDGEDFNVPELVEREDWLGLSSSYTNGLLNALHERGSIRLVRTGHPEWGQRTKIWKVNK